MRAKAITSTNRVTTCNSISDGEVYSPSKPVYLLRVSEIIFFLLQKASTRPSFFRSPGDKREEEARGEDIVSRRRQHPPAGLRHRVESRISINAATLSLAFTKANIGGEKKPSADVDERRQFSFKSSPCRCALSIITMSPLLHVCVL